MNWVGREIALATLHGKQRVLARPLRQGLGLHLRHTTAVDTDQFGSFCGTQPRLLDAVATAQRKAEGAMDALDLDLGIASEGSFGPHPSVPMLAAGIECLVLVDRSCARVVVEQAISLRTNYSAMAVGPGIESQGWLKQVGFPSHAVMVRPHQRAGEPVHPWLAKGVSEGGDLAALVERAAAASSVGQAWLETDMRAHCNPTRMASIRRLAFQLVRRLRNPCPACTEPGFGPVETIPGLPCSACGLASRWVMEQVWGCGLCGHRERRPRPDGLQALDPMYCDYCNP